MGEVTAVGHRGWVRVSRVLNACLLAVATVVFLGSSWALASMVLATSNGNPGIGGAIPGLAMLACGPAIAASAGAELGLRRTSKPAAWVWTCLAWTGMWPVAWQALSIASDPGTAVWLASLLVAVAVAIGVAACLQLRQPTVTPATS